MDDLWAKRHQQGICQFIFKDGGVIQEYGTVVRTRWSLSDRGPLGMNVLVVGSWFIFFTFWDPLGDNRKTLLGRSCSNYCRCNLTQNKYKAKAGAMKMESYIHTET